MINEARAQSQNIRNQDSGEPICEVTSTIKVYDTALPPVQLSVFKPSTKERKRHLPGATFLSSHQHTSYFSRTRGRCPCKFFLAGVNFYRFNAKNWHFRQILCKKVAFFTDLTRKIGVFRCKFYSPKILSV